MSAIEAASLAEATRVRQVSRTAARVIDGKVLIVVIDEKKLHTLNLVGTRVWELADGRSLGEIADVLVTEFEVDRETALADIRAFVQELVGLGALQTEPVDADRARSG